MTHAITHSMLVFRMISDEESWPSSVIDFFTIPTVLQVILSVQVQSEDSDQIFQCTLSEKSNSWFIITQENNGFGAPWGRHKPYLTVDIFEHLS